MRLSRLSNRKNEEKKYRDQGDINKHTNICIVGVPRREARGIKNISKIILGNSLGDEKHSFAHPRKFSKV